MSSSVVSSNDEREVVVKCLTLGAIDYLIKPLRHNELRHIWTRVWWWRRVRDGEAIAIHAHDLTTSTRLPSFSLGLEFYPRLPPGPLSTPTRTSPRSVLMTARTQSGEMEGLERYRAMHDVIPHVQ